MTHPHSTHFNQHHSKPAVITAGPSGKPFGTDGGSAIVTETDTSTQDDLATPWNVIVYNDPVNLMAYVTMVIRRIFGYSQQKAESMMLDVHQKGLCVVWSGEKEKAEFYVKELQSYQLLAVMKKAAD